MQSGELSPGRRAQQTRSVDTRNKILDAAVQVLVQDGYSGATTLRIQQSAGVSRGRLLHHYPARDDLLVAAVAHLTQVQIGAAATDVEWALDPSNRVGQAVETMWEEFRQPYFWASIELWVAARVNERLREALLPHERRLGAHIRSKTDSFFGPELVDRPNYVRTRETLISSMRGEALTYAFWRRPADTEPHLRYWRAIAVDALCTAGR